MKALGDFVAMLDLVPASMVPSRLPVMGSDTSVLGEIAKLIESGKLTPIVETVLPLSEARKAHETQ